jgi:hypothetical protein
MKKATDTGSTADEAREKAGVEVVQKLQGAHHIVVKYALINPGFAEGNGEAQENGSTVFALGEDGEGIAEILIDVLARGKSNLPLGERSGIRFLKAEVPTGNLPAKAGSASVLEATDKIHSDRQVRRKFGASIRDAVDGLVVGKMKFLAGEGSRDVGQDGRCLCI